MRLNILILTLFAFLAEVMNPSTPFVRADCTSLPSNFSQSHARHFRLSIKTPMKRRSLGEEKTPEDAQGHENFFSSTHPTHAATCAEIISLDPHFSSIIFPRGPEPDYVFLFRSSYPSPALSFLEPIRPWDFLFPV